MGLLTSKKLETMDDLFLDQIKDLYDAEKRLVDALPKMAEAASSPELKNAFESHLTETRGQVERLERVFQTLGKDPSRETCDAMKGLISEGESIVNANGDAAIKDAALIAAAQRVEHYEMAGYGSARSFANQLGRSDVAQILQETLDEEGAADQKLTAIAEGGVNQQAS